MEVDILLLIRIKDFLLEEHRSSTYCSHSIEHCVCTKAYLFRDVKKVIEEGENP